jgi:hypothetical protein
MVQCIASASASGRLLKMSALLLRKVEVLLLLLGIEPMVAYWVCQTFL